MHYWITTHWPPRVGESGPPGRGVWLPHDRGHIGAQMRAGDRVIVYQAKSGRTLVRRNADETETRVPCQEGREGVVAITEVLEPIHYDGAVETEEYADGTRVRWSWYAATRVLSSAGFIPRKALSVLLGFSEDYAYRGFGDAHSGLKRIDEATFDRVVAAFAAGAPPLAPVVRTDPRAGGGREEGGGEGDVHRRLKEYVAGAPAEALHESGLELVRMEHPFSTGDRADVVLRDRLARLVGLEVEVDVGDAAPEGMLQAIKYARMLEPVYDAPAGEARAVLVAHSITDAMRARCMKYGVECVTVTREAVDGWHAARLAAAAVLPFPVPQGPVALVAS